MHGAASAGTAWYVSIFLWIDNCSILSDLFTGELLVAQAGEVKVKSALETGLHIVLKYLTG